MAVMAIDPVAVGLSTSAGNPFDNQTNRPVTTLADLSPSGLPPSMVVRPTAGTSSVFRYPDDTPPYYFKMRIQRYQRAGWLSIGRLDPEATIILPLPQKMVDDHQVEYELVALQELGLVMNGVPNNTADALAGLGAQLGHDLTGRGGQALAQYWGYAINNFLTVMLKGPTYKRRDFVWHVSPKTEQESIHLRDIISLINRSMSPALPATLGSAFFAWPRIFFPSLEFSGPIGGGSRDLGDWTFHMKPSVIVDASFDYTPSNVWAAYAPTRAPESVVIRLTFLELEYWLRDSDWGPGFRGSGVGPGLDTANSSSPIP
jgi:hypothetical protein